MSEGVSTTIFSSSIQALHENAISAKRRTNLIMATSSLSNKPAVSDLEKDAELGPVERNHGHMTHISDSSAMGPGEDLLAGENENIALVRKMHHLNNVFCLLPVLLRVVSVG